MLQTLAGKINPKTDENIFDVTAPYFELVEYEVKEVRVIDSKV